MICILTNPGACAHLDSWEPPRVPEWSVVEAACRPADSPWRAQARLSAAFCGVEL